jgi:DNA-binding NarL/FixJ family response regulator
VAGLNVLVVDDHQMVAEGLAAVIRSSPEIGSVTCVHSGAEARRQASTIAPDVVVVDLCLPDIGGVKLVRQLRQACPSVRSVLISASFTPEALDDAVEAGITALASKLASGEELVQVVRAAAAGTAYVSSDVMPLLARLRDLHRDGATLSGREREVIQALADGCNVPTIAARLHLSQHTVRNHIRRSMQKLGVRRQLDAVLAAAQAGMIELPS